MLRKTQTALAATMLAMSALAMGALGSATAEAQDQETGAVDLDNGPRRTTRAPVRGRAAAEPGPLRVYGGLSFAAGGEIKHEDADDGVELSSTIGFQAGVDFVVMDYFAIGAETRFLFPKAEDLNDDDRFFLWDIAVKPRGRYVFDDMPLELYLALPLGLTVAGNADALPIGEPLLAPVLPGNDANVDGKVGWNIGLVAGANWFFTENLGVGVELGWHFHKFGLESSLGRVDFDYQVKMNQFLFFGPNFVYAL